MKVLEQSNRSFANAEGKSTEIEKQVKDLLLRMADGVAELKSHQENDQQGAYEHVIMQVSSSNLGPIYLEGNELGLKMSEEIQNEISFEEEDTGLAEKIDKHSSMIFLTSMLTSIASYIIEGTKTVENVHKAFLTYLKSGASKIHSVMARQGIALPVMTAVENTVMQEFALLVSFIFASTFIMSILSFVVLPALSEINGTILIMAPLIILFMCCMVISHTELQLRLSSLEEQMGITNFWFTTLRAFATALVLLLHTSILFGSSFSAFPYTTTLFLALLLFFVVSLCYLSLLLDKPETNEQNPTANEIRTGSAKTILLCFLAIVLVLASALGVQIYNQQSKTFFSAPAQAHENANAHENAKSTHKNVKRAHMREKSIPNSTIMFIYKPNRN